MLNRLDNSYKEYNFTVFASEEKDTA